VRLGRLSPVAGRAQDRAGYWPMAAGARGVFLIGLRRTITPRTARPSPPTPGFCPFRLFFGGGDEMSAASGPFFGEPLSRPNNTRSGYDAR